MRHKILAFEQFLTRHPEYQGKVSIYHLRERARAENKFLGGSYSGCPTNY